MAVGDRTVAVRLLAEVSGYVSGMNQAALAGWRVARQTETIGKSTKDSMDGAGASAGRFGSVMAGLAGIVVLGLGAKALGALLDFEDAMARLGAASMASAGEMELFRKAALKAGQDTAFTGAQAADAMTELAKAGVGTADILGGALDGALALAAAGELDVAEAAETAATAMVQFGLSGSDVMDIADMLAAGAGKAQGSVHDLGMALKQGGQVASMVGWTLEETTATLTAFAAAGLVGSDAGTSMKTMLLRLANPSNEAKEVMKQLGINVYDAGGNMLGASQMAGMLEQAFGGLDPAARNAAMGILFGTDAVRAANVMFTNGQIGISGWQGKIQDGGYASEVAAKKLDTLRGDIKKLTGTAQAFVTTSGAGVNNMLRDTVQAADEATKFLIKLGEGIEDLAGRARHLRKELTWDPDEGFGFKDIVSQEVSSYERFWAELRNSVPQQVGMFFGAMNKAIDEGTNPFEAMGDAWAEADAAAKRAETAALEYGEQQRFANRAMADSVGPAGLLKQASDEAAVSGGTLADNLEDVGATADEATDMIEDLKDQILGLGSTSIDTQKTQDDLWRAINDALEPVDDLAAATAELERVRGTDEEAAAAEEVAVARAALAIEGNSDAALKNRDKLFALAEQGKTTAGEFYALTGDVAGTTAQVALSREKFIAAATAMYATHYPAQVAAQKASDLATEYGLIPEDVNTIITQYGADTAIAQARTLKDLLLTLDGTTARTRVVNVTESHRVSYSDFKAAQLEAAGSKDGGWIGARGYPTGGWVSGPGGPRTDSIFAKLSNGEFVVNAHSASLYGPLLEAINSGRQLPAGQGTTININATTESIVREIRAHERIRGLARRQVA